MSHQADAKRALDERGYTGTLVRGDNPLKLFEKPVRDRIVDSYYWKEQCFGLNAATLLDRAVELTFIGGTYGVAQKPTPFLCLAFKLLQLLPEREIITFYLEKAGEEFKYLRALAAFYIRLAWEKDEEVYATLEPYLADGRKLKRRTREGWALTYMDEFVDDLLNKTRVCATTLPKINPRLQLEDADKLEPRESALGEELEELDREDEEGSENSEGEVRENGHANGNRSGGDDGLESHTTPGDAEYRQDLVFPPSNGFLQTDQISLLAICRDSSSTAFQLRPTTYIKKWNKFHSGLSITTGTIMGAYTALTLRTRGVLNMLLGIYGAFYPRPFFNMMISPGWEGSHSCDATLNYALGRAAIQHAWHLVALGALFVLVAGQTPLHKTATSIAGFSSGSGLGVFLGLGGNRGVAVYHIAWAILHSVSYEIDRREDKKVVRDVKDKSKESCNEKEKSTGSSSETVQKSNEGEHVP
ncbi:Pre-mRNA-splicing factor 38 [Cercospora zeina]